MNDYQRTETKRDYFEVLEGVESGKSFSVKQGNLSTPSSTLYKPGAELFFSLGRKELTYPGGRVRAITALGNKAIAAGRYPVQIPDFPHEIGMSYLPKTRFAKNWFYLGRGAAIPGNNDRYLHTGQISAGCVTVDPSGWTALYQFLIVCRVGDGKNVGFVTVNR